MCGLDNALFGLGVHLLISELVLNAIPMKYIYFKCAIVYSLSKRTNLSVLLFPFLIRINWIIFF